MGSPDFSFFAKGGPAMRDIPEWAHFGPRAVTGVTTAALHPQQT
jgi:hypothetical protein